MNKEHEVHAPDISEEEMKMPETANSALSKPNSGTPLNGVVIVILALLLVGILGGLYMWFSQLMLSESTSVASPAIERPTPEENNEPESTTAEAAVETQQAISTSDEITAIEADIEATDLDTLDAELNAIDAELEAALQAN